MFFAFYSLSYLRKPYKSSFHVVTYYVYFAPDPNIHNTPFVILFTQKQNQKSVPTVYIYHIRKFLTFNQKQFIDKSRRCVTTVYIFGICHIAPDVIKWYLHFMWTWIKLNTLCGWFNLFGLLKWILKIIARMNLKHHINWFNFWSSTNEKVYEIMITFAAPHAKQTVNRCTKKAIHYMAT